MSTIKAIRLRVGRMPKVVEIDSGLEALQSEVGGLIELVRLDEQTDAFVNEEGLLSRLPFNCCLPVNGGEDVPVFGNVIVVSHNDEGETIGLTNGQEDQWFLNLTRVRMRQERAGPFATRGM